MFPERPDHTPPGDDSERTLRFSIDKLTSVKVSPLSRYDADALEGLVFHPVPRHYKGLDTSRYQRVILRFGSSVPQIKLGLDIYGDVVLGRGGKAGRVGDVDIDLSDLEAFKQGVSRRHAMLRPTHSKLFLIDLDSTNGTFVNMIPVGRGVAREIKQGDTISLAGLNFVIEFISLATDGEVTPVDKPVRSALSRIIDTLSLKAAPAEEPPAQEPPPVDPGDLPVTSKTLPPGDVPHVKSLPLPPTRPIIRTPPIRPGSEKASGAPGDSGAKKKTQRFDTD